MARDIPFLAVSRLQRGHVALDAGLDLIHPLLQLGASEVLVPGVHRPELAAVDGRHRMRKVFVVVDTPQ